MPAFVPVPHGQPPLAVVTPRDVVSSRAARFGAHLRLFDRGPLVRLRTPGFCFWFTNDAEMARHVLSENASNYVKPPSYAALREVTGDGLLTTDGEVWRRQRKLVQHAFRPKAMAALGATMVDEAQAAAERWESHAKNGTSFDLAAEMTRVTLAMVSRCLFGVDFSRDAAALGRSLVVALRHADARLFSLAPAPPHWPTPGNLRARRAIDELGRAVDDIIARRRRSPGGGDLLGELLQAKDDATGGTLSDLELRDQILTLFLAGHETTANALSWTFYLVGQHPLVARALRAELDQVLGGRAPTVEDLPRLPYTARVFAEAMRLYPPAWSVGRAALAPDRLGPYEVPAGAIVGVHILALQRNPVYYPDPHRFDPDRFLPEVVAQRPRNAYAPFGAGPRVCIGQHFALQEGQLILATLAQRFEMELLDRRPMDAEMTLVLRPARPVNVVVERRPSPSLGSTPRSVPRLPTRGSDGSVRATPLA